MRRLLLGGVFAAALLFVAVAAPARADYEYTAESPGCGYLRFYPPRAEATGPLADSHLIRGPAGALFGRTVAAVKDQLVWWTVPMSDNARVQVHRGLIPSLTRVEANLAAAAARGLDYQVRAAYTSAYNARTSVAHDGISYHGLGAAVDINSISNPYSLDGDLITDIPAWFSQAWEEAGMCWGGNWNHVKDPMHFSWEGPKATPGAAIPAPLPPLTSARQFTARAGLHDVVFGADSFSPIVAEMSGDGAPDVARIRPWGDDAVLETAISRAGYRDCSVWRWWLDDPPPGTPLLGDVAGTGRPDLLYPDESGATLVFARLAAADGYARTADIVTGATTSPGRRYTFADIDGDAADDLVVLWATEGSLAIEVWSAQSAFKTLIRSATVDGVDLEDDVRLGVADRDVDGKDDLFLVKPGEQTSTVTVISGRDVSAVAEVIAAAGVAAGDSVGFEDYDGDGRPDLVVATAEGTLEAWLGNSPLAGSPSAWFVPDDFECPEGTVPYFYTGRFADDDDSEFQADIEWLAQAEVTRGCNPPFEDRFCPDDLVTRGQMAAFLTRALGLEPATSRFVDDDGSVFEADIGALAAAGITKGCNPPANDEFCPDQSVTRGEMAAFLHRALHLAAAANRFVDDDGSVFEADIGALAAAGITKGCNPPANDEFCPNQSVTRGQMAAFLHRADHWLGER
ncbi:MAG TPA: M15 family metallopeptidase [Acidimicrobiia bacterium]|nr:M15 family metallopeptidase [Acidimicrobiia bacterium]